jgi:uncharacterized protein YndB with AHSA1/START domain
MTLSEPRIVSASRVLRASRDRIFELIADPARQPEWDGNDNIAYAAPGQRVHSVGDVFTTTLTMGSLRVNHVVEFVEGRRIAWQPAEPTKIPPGHLWRWELEPIDETRTLVVHTYDWTNLKDESRFERARATTVDRLMASIIRLVMVAES